VGQLGHAQGLEQRRHVHPEPAAVALAQAVPATNRVAVGAADEQKPAAGGTVEEWGRSPNNPVGGWYGLRKGYRGRFAMYVPPLMEALGLAELTHDAKNNRMRAV
jgi:hypothetical protein